MEEIDLSGSVLTFLDADPIEESVNKAAGICAICAQCAACKYGCAACTALKNLF